MVVPAVVPTLHNEKLDEALLIAVGSKEDSSSDEVNTTTGRTKHIEPRYIEDRNISMEANWDKAENPHVHRSMSIRLFTSLTAMSFCWIGSQIPLYLYGSVLPLINADIGGTNGVFLWMIIGYLIPNAAFCPFVGAFSDMFGRKAVAAVGQVLLIIGPIVVSTAQDMGAAIAGMVLTGMGAGLNELIALAGTSELVPVRKRPIYIGALSATILPFAPMVLYAQAIAQGASWRWVGMLICIWNFVGLVLVLFFYHDPAKYLTRRSRREILGEIDVVGGVLSIGGVVSFMTGMQFGAQQYSWTSTRVLVLLIVGFVLICAFFVWEIRFARFPMVPAALFSKDKCTMIAILVIVFFSGGNFKAVILFWPPQSYNMYGPGVVQNGLRGLPITIGIVLGGCMSLILISLTRGRTTYIMLFWTVLMTACTGAMSAATTTNLNHVVYPIISLACLGVGGVVVPSAIIAQIVAPTELIGTITAISLSLRSIGGAVAFTTFYNIFYAKYNVQADLVGFQLARQGISYDYETLVSLINYASFAQYDKLHDLIEMSPLVHHKDIAYDIILNLTQQAFASAYRWPYWISIVFGGTCIVASCFLKDIRKIIEGT